MNSLSSKKIIFIWSLHRYSICSFLSTFHPVCLVLFSRKEAQLDEEGQFLVRIIYDDSKTYDLVAAASKVLSKLSRDFLSLAKLHVDVKGHAWSRSRCMATGCTHSNGRTVTYSIRLQATLSCVILFTNSLENRGALCPSHKKPSLGKQKVLILNVIS